MYFEGAGDALFCGDTLFAGYRIRSDARGHQQIGERARPPRDSAGAGRPVLLPPRHLLLPARAGLAIYFPAGLRRLRPRALAEHVVATLIPVADDEARAVRLQRRGRRPDRRHQHRLPAAARSSLRARGFDAGETPLDEFVKAGGSAKCLTLRLDGEGSGGVDYYGIHYEINPWMSRQRQSDPTTARCSGSLCITC